MAILVSNTYTCTSRVPQIQPKLAVGFIAAFNLARAAGLLDLSTAPKWPYTETRSLWGQVQVRASQVPWSARRERLPAGWGCAQWQRCGASRASGHHANATASTARSSAPRAASTRSKSPSPFRCAPPYQLFSEQRDSLRCLGWQKCLRGAPIQNQEGFPGAQHHAWL